MAAIFFVVLMFGSFSPARADQVTAREVARMNNCPPKKIEVYQEAIGADASTVYRVQCIMPKTVGTENAKGPDALLISCDESLCTLLRPVSEDKK